MEPEPDNIPVGIREDEYQRREAAALRNITEVKFPSNEREFLTMLSTYVSQDLNVGVLYSLSSDIYLRYFWFGSTIGCCYPDYCTYAQRSSSLSGRREYRNEASAGLFLGSPSEIFCFHCGFQYDLRTLGNQDVVRIHSDTRPHCQYLALRQTLLNTRPEDQGVLSSELMKTRLLMSKQVYQLVDSQGAGMVFNDPLFADLGNLQLQGLTESVRRISNLTTLCDDCLSFGIIRQLCDSWNFENPTLDWNVLALVSTSVRNWSAMAKISPNVRSFLDSCFVETDEIVAAIPEDNDI